ncbi:MAG TPA: hypothetical protein VFX60_19110 [Micromonospora sp.]|nr:hypothetical protein [Micromonospora sp.]
MADEYQGQHRAARETVMWVAGNVRVTASSDVDDTLAGLIAAAGTWPGTLAWRVHQWMDHEDQRVRRVLREPADRHPIPQLRCPACGLSGMLALLTAPPQGQRPVACASAICVCAGPGCACGVSQPAQGLPHVWTQPQLTELFQARDAAARGAA